MNASPANLNSVNPVQPPSAAGKPQESASGTPFSQVLSSEIAQNQRGSETRKDGNPGPDTQDSAQAYPADASTTDTAKTDALPVAAASDPSQSAAISVAVETFLALALSPDPSKSVPTRMNDAASERSAARGANIQVGRDAKKDLPSKMLQAAQLAAEQAAQPATEKAGSQKLDPAFSGKAIATPFSGQLAAARQSDSMNIPDPLSDLANNSIMRATPQASVETPTPLGGASANRLAPSVGTTAWGQALGEKIVWMAAGAQQTATLTLNPPNLGPLQIVLNISNEQATASFFSTQPEVRQALEAAFPRLREMMNEAGIQLGQATVSADTPQQNAPDPRSQRAALPFPTLDEASAGGLPLSQGPALQSGRGLVDTYA